MTRMRLLYVVHQFFPEGSMGTERFTLNMALSARRAGHHVRVLTWSKAKRGFSKEHRGFLLRNYRFQGVAVTAFRHKEIEPWDFPLSLGNRLKLFQLADDILASGRYDLIHFAHLFRVAPFAYAAMERKIPYIATLTDFFAICYRGTLINLENKLCGGPQQGKTCAADCLRPPMPEDYLFQRVSSARKILSNATLITTPSRHLAEQVLREHPRLEIKVVPHGISLRSKVELKRRSRSDKSPIRFGFLGQVEHHKGVHLLIQAFKKIANPACRLDIFGRGFDKNYAADLLALAYRDSRIVFRGPYKTQQELIRILDELDAVCVPSIWPENYPLVILEALARSVPVIGARIGGIPEMLRDGSNGFLFEPGDAKDLHKVMAGIVSRPKSLDLLRRGIRPVRTVEEEAAEFEGLYQAVLNASAGDKELAFST